MTSASRSVRLSQYETVYTVIVITTDFFISPFFNFSMQHSILHFSILFPFINNGNLLTILTENRLLANNAFALSAVFKPRVQTRRVELVVACRASKGGQRECFWM